MSDHEFDEMVDEMKRSHNPPPDVPRDRMWARIEQQRRARPAEPERPTRHAVPARRPWRPWRLGLAMAAVLVLGIVLGRATLRPAAPPQVATNPGARTDGAVTAAAPAPPAAGRSALVRFAATSLFQRADVLLTDLQTGRCDRAELDPLPTWAGSMLVQTRLLLDSELTADPDMKALLQDLELILARIADISRENCTGDVDRIRKDIQDKATLDRLRLAAAGA